MEVQKVKDIYFKLKQERELVSSVELPWVIKVALPYLNELADGKDKITDSERDKLYDGLKALSVSISETRNQAIDITNDNYLTSNSKSILLEDLTEQRIEQAIKLNAGLKKYVGTLEKISAISRNAQTELQKNSSKAYGVFGESNTIFQNIQSTVGFATNAIKNDMYIFGVMLTPLEETISELTTIAYYRKPKSSIQLRRDPDKSYEYHYAINRWVEQHYPNLIGDPTSYEYQQMFNREGAKHNLTGDEFKVKIYLDYVEWKEQQLIDMRTKEDLYSAKINEVPKQETLLERFKNKLGLTK